MPLIPGTPEYFFHELSQFLKQNAQGEVRCMVLSQTSVGQFWVHSSNPDLVWQFGMTKAADTVLSMEYHNRTLEARAALEKQEAEEELATIPVPKGKPQ